MVILKYKKMIRTMSLLAISVFLTTSCGEKDKTNEAKDEVVDIAETTTEDLENWVGEYTYNEMISPGKKFDMTVNVYEGEDGGILADVSVAVDVLKLEDKYKATVKGNKEKIDLYFVDLEEENSEPNADYICSLVLVDNEVGFENVDIGKFYDDVTLNDIADDGLKSWIDVYEFEEEVSSYNSYTTEIYVYERTDGYVGADITVSGFQVYEEYEAKAKGDNQQIDFYSTVDGSYICSLIKKNGKVVFDSGIINNLYREIEEPGVDSNDEPTEKEEVEVVENTNTSTKDEPDDVYEFLLNMGVEFETTGEKYFYEKGDFDGDGKSEIIYSVLEKDGDLDQRYYSRIYYLESTDKGLELKYETYTGYDVNEIVITNVDIFDEPVLYLGQTNHNEMKGFILLKFSDNELIMYQNCASPSGRGSDQIVDMDEDGAYDGFIRTGWDGKTFDEADIQLYWFTEDGYLMAE